MLSVGSKQTFSSFHDQASELERYPTLKWPEFSRFCRKLVPRINQTDPNKAPIDRSDCFSEEWLVRLQDEKFGLCATASESSPTQWLPYFRGNRMPLGDRRRSSNGTRIFRVDNALVLCQSSEFGCHCMTVFGHAVLFHRQNKKPLLLR